jgi:hypothetical protein
LFPNLERRAPGKTPAAIIVIITQPTIKARFPQLVLFLRNTDKQLKTNSKRTIRLLRMVLQELYQH